MNHAVVLFIRQGKEKFVLFTKAVTMVMEFVANHTLCRIIKEKILGPSYNALLPMGFLYRWSCGGGGIVIHT